MMTIVFGSFEYWVGLRFGVALMRTQALSRDTVLKLKRHDKLI